jgi:hypothetical protein
MRDHADVVAVDDRGRADDLPARLDAAAFQTPAD